MHRMLLRGNGYAIILRDKRNGGRINGLKPLESWQCYAGRSIDGSMTYIVYDEMGGIPTPYDQDDILHFAGFRTYFDIGSSVLATGSYNALNISLAAEQRAQSAFVNGILSNLVIKREGGWNQQSKDEFRKKFEERYGRGNESADSPFVTDDKTTIEPLGLSPTDAQLLESREFQITDIARAFGLPSYLVNQEAKNTSFGSGVSRIAEAFLRFTLTPIIRRFEGELTRKLFIAQPTKYCQLDTTGLTRATTIERFAMYQQALGGNGQSGHMSVNDVREAENKPRLTRMQEIGGETVNVYDMVFTGFDAPGAVAATTDAAMAAVVDEEAAEMAGEMD